MLVEEKITRGYREIVLLTLSCCALFFLIALITFNSNDPGWSHSSTYQKLHNSCGLFGAWLADLTLSFMGLTAYLLPMMIFWTGYRFYKPKWKSFRTHFMVRWSGFFVTVFSGTAFLFLHLYFFRNLFDLPDSVGGILGNEIGDVLLRVLGNSGSALFVLGLFMLGVTMMTGLNWVKLAGVIGKMVLGLFQIMSKAAVTAPKKDVVEQVLSRPEKKKRPAEKTIQTIQYEETEQDDDVGDIEDILMKGIHHEIPKEAPKEIIREIPKEVVKKDIPINVAVSKPLPKIKADKKKPMLNALPSLSLLEKREVTVRRYSKQQLEGISQRVEEVLKDYGVSAQVEGVHSGPVITRFELRLAAGVKVSRISGLAKDLARGLSVTSVRVVEIIEGKSVIGLEIPNQEREMVSLLDLLVSEQFEQAKSKLSIAMGKDISGKPVVADLAKMPHALVAGTTGSGKSVAINTMILSLLYKATPEEVRLIMIDPKMLELSVYEDIPHLLTPVVTDMKDAQNALRWAVGEMERRYKLMSKVGVRNLAGFNQIVKDAEATGQPLRNPMLKSPIDEAQYLETLPNIVIVIDELADMMMVVGKKVEELIARLAQKARAAGIHLILATQRPSVDVLTGLIKANVPTRISFQVSSKIDSRTILDQGGAESLLGNGDMLFLPSGTSIPLRAHGAFVDDHEVHRVVEFLRQTGPANYLDEITQERSDTGELTNNNDNRDVDSLYDEAVQFVIDSQKASISSVQRKFKIGYNRAARIIEEMEAAGLVSPPERNGNREVLVPPDR